MTYIVLETEKYYILFDLFETYAQSTSVNLCCSNFLLNIENVLEISAQYKIIIRTIF